MEVVETTMCNGVVVGIEGYTENWEDMSLRLPLLIMTVQQNASCDSSEPELELYITGKPRLSHSVNLLIYV